MISDNDRQRIAKNAVMLYLRMIVTVAVSLYTSRVVLDTLGVNDYGIYSAVAGTVGMLSFLNTSMAVATSRFLTYEMGRGDDSALKKTFASAVAVHFALGIILVLVLETAGMWYVDNMLVMPDGSLPDAKIVFQFAVAAMFAGVLQTPWSASVIAREAMGFYAFLEILNVVLKLVIVYMLLVFDCDKLLLYGGLTAGVSVVTGCCYAFYVRSRFDDCRLSAKPDKAVIRSMLSFSGFDLFGNMSQTASVQGYALVLNYFFGTVVNAANGIAVIVQGTLKGFAISIALAFRPQIIKQYAAGEIAAMQSLITTASSYTLCMYLALATPLIFNIDFVLGLWLGTPPDYTSGMTVVVLVATAFAVAVYVVNGAVHATGHIRLFSLLTGTVYFCQPVALLILIHAGCRVITAYAVMIPVSALGLAVAMVMMKTNIRSVSLTAIVVRSYIPVTAVAALTALLTRLCLTQCDTGWPGLFTACGISVVCYGSFFLFYVLDRESRKKLLSKIKIHD